MIRDARSEEGERVGGGRIPGSRSVLNAHPLAQEGEVRHER